MDPLTHTLVGASLAATRLGTRTRCATAALVVGANLPDVDVLSYIAGSDVALGFRRGWTHGVPALVVLPAVLAATLALWGRWRESGGDAPPLAPRWLFGLSYLAVLTHPALDWLNTYGMRWWMPFDGTWYYGDSVFIVDPWLWLLLGVPWLAGRRPTPSLLVAWSLVALPMLFFVARRGPHYLPHLAIAFALLLAALLWRRGGLDRYRRTAAALGLAVAALFIGALLVLHALTEASVRQRLEYDGGPIETLMVGPMPANPLAWEYVVEQSGRLRHGTVSWLDGGRLVHSGFDEPTARSDPRWDQIRTVRDIDGFLGWARFPWVAEISPSDRAQHGSARLIVLDARYRRVVAPGFGGVPVDLEP